MLASLFPSASTILVDIEDRSESSQADLVGFRVSPDRFFPILAAGAVILVGLSLVMRLLWVTDTVRVLDHSVNVVLNVDHEANLLTWFSTLLLFGVACGFYAWMRAAIGRDAFTWGMLSAFFLYVSLDESAELHEQTTTKLRDALGTDGLLYFAWVVPGIVIGAIIVWLSWGTVSRLRSDVRQGLVFGAVLVVTGAVGAEMLSGLFADDQESVAYTLIVHVEELLELLGVIVLLRVVTTSRPGARKVMVQAERSPSAREQPS